MIIYRNLLSGLATALLTFLIVVGSPATEAASEPDHQAATSFINTLASSALSALRQPNLTMAQREAIVRKLLQQGFDVAFIGRFVMGRH